MALSAISARLGIASLNQAGVRASLPVVAAPHEAAGRAVNWLLGKGVPLVVCGPNIVPAWLPTYFSFWIHPDNLHPNFWWMFSISCVNPYGTPRAVNVFIEREVHFPDAGAIRETFTTREDGVAVMMQMREDVLVTNTPMEIKCIVHSDFPTPDEEATAEDYYYLIIHGIHVVEGPQVRVDGYGIPLSTLEARQPIYWDGEHDPARHSITAISKIATLAHENYARRGSMFSWWDPIDEAETTESGDYVAVFPVSPALQCRHISLGQTRGTVRVNVCASVTGGTGFVRCTMTTGDSIVFEVTSTLMAWVGEEELLVSTDDPNRWPDDGGQRDATRDEMLVEMLAPAGETIKVKGLCVTEASTTGGESESANVLVMGGEPITYEGEYIFIPVPYPP